MDVECGNVKYIPTAAHYNSGDVLFFPRPIRVRISRATIHFFSCFSFCLTKAYNFCHQVALVGGPMRRDVAIRWTNRKRDGTVWHVPLRLTNAQNSRMLLTMNMMSDDVS